MKLGLEEFLKLNKVFLFADIINEIVTLLNDKEVKKSFKVTIENNFAKLEFKILGNKVLGEKKISLMIPGKKCQW